MSNSNQVEYTPESIQKANYEFEMDAIDRHVVPMLDDIIQTQPRQQISEEQFKRFVPMFFGEDTSQERQTEWVNIAGSAVAEVTVIDNNGNKLFDVPPLCDTTTIDGMNRNGRIAVHAIFQHYEDSARNLPALAGNQFTANLLHSIPSLVTEETPEHKERQERWNRIAERYNTNTEIKNNINIVSSTMPNFAGDSDNDNLEV